jgi:putative spermidine/putrescine transport system substrate-binding protein
MKHNRIPTLLFVVSMAVALALSACAPTAASGPAAVPATSAPASQPTAASNMDALIAAAKQEGALTVITLPRDWCHYGELMDSFTAKYGIKITDLIPDGGSQEEIEAIKANKDNKGPQAPDVVDVGLAFGQPNRDLFEPYKVQGWADIPDNAKSPDGAYYGDYYGVMSFFVNTDVVKNVPQDWSDLLKTEYKGQIAMTGDPRKSNQAYSTVFAAGLGTGGSLDNPQAGLDFFAKLNKAGNLVPVISNNALVAKGETPIRLTWDYLALAGQDEFKGNPKTTIVVPKSGRYAGIYLQAISKYAPHLNAAKLWEEYLYSDEGQLEWLRGYCHPVRQAALDAKGLIPADLKAKLPSVEGAVFATADQLINAQQLIAKNWDSQVGADVK